MSCSTRTRSRGLASTLDLIAAAQPVRSHARSASSARVRAATMRRSSSWLSGSPGPRRNAFRASVRSTRAPPRSRSQYAARRGSCRLKDVVGAELAERLTVTADGCPPRLDHVDEVTLLSLPWTIVRHVRAAVAQRRSKPPQPRVRERSKDGRPPEELEAYDAKIRPRRRSSEAAGWPTPRAQRSRPRRPAPRGASTSIASGASSEPIPTAAITTSSNRPENAADHALVGVLLHDREPRDAEQAVREARERETHDGEPRARATGPGE